MPRAQVAFSGAMTTFHECPLIFVLVATVHPSMSKRVPGVGEGGVFGGHERA